MEWKIYLFGLQIDEIEEVKDFTGSAEEVAEEVRKLQSGYCEIGENPSLRFVGSPVKAVIAKRIKTDWHYEAHCKKNY